MGSRARQGSACRGRKGGEAPLTREVCVGGGVMPIFPATWVCAEPRRAVGRLEGRDDRQAPLGGGSRTGHLQRMGKDEVGRAREGGSWAVRRS
jgi:hypothetical protein